jgi:hypothetical protein
VAGIGGFIGGFLAGVYSIAVGIKQGRMSVKFNNPSTSEIMDSIRHPK